MGLIRKMTSISTLGAVDLHSDKERIARNTAKTNRTMKAQNKLLKQQNRIQQSTAQATTPISYPAPAAYPAPQPVVAQGPPAGWYQDTEHPEMDRWYDGTVWTDFRQPRQPS
jgi:Tfp pilus assembly protein PilX